MIPVNLFQYNFIGCLIVTFVAATKASYFTHVMQVRNQLREMKIVSMTSNFSVEVSAENVQPFVTVSWEYDNAPENIPLDGWMITFTPNYEKDTRSILPRDNCNSGNDFIWMKNISECQADETAKKSCNGLDSSFCLCEKENCSFAKFKEPMIGPPIALYTFMSAQNFKYPFTLPINIQHTTLPVAFHKLYTLDIRPYYREYIPSPVIYTGSVPVLKSCPELLKEKAKYELQAAIDKCCVSGFKHFSPYNIQIKNIKPNPIEKTIEARISWFPPNQKQIQYKPTAYLTSRPTSDGSKAQYPEVELNITRKPTQYKDCEGKVFHENSIRISNMVPNKNYKFFNTALYNGACNGSKSETICQNTFLFTAPDIDFCDEEWEYCDENAVCSTSDSTTKCKCKFGYDGNGISSTGDFQNMGTGCFLTNFCLKNNITCSTYAECINYPLEGANCSCLAGYFGDGYEDGSGCVRKERDITGLIIGSTLAGIALIFVVVIAAIILSIRRRKEMEKRRMSVFVTENDNGIITALMNNNELQEDDGPWLPTFGEKWEVPLDTIKRDGILGRGHFGIVYKATISLITKPFSDSGNSFDSTSTECSFLSNLKENEKYKDKTQLVVSLKTLQESTMNQANYLQFLSEIGFMLNLETHENIVQVIGCCTTTRDICLIMEYLKYGDLLHFLWNVRDITKAEEDPVFKVSVEDLEHMACQVACGMEQLSRMRVIHGDLAARNVLVGENRMCKITDFGLASDVYRYDHIRGKVERNIPVKWASPERLMNGEMPITYKSDVWSFGNLMYEIFTLGCSPHPDVDAEELLDRLKEGYRMKKPTLCNEQTFSVMNSCWMFTPSARPSFKQITKLLLSN